MRKYMKLLSSKTKVKCIGITLLAFASSYLASAWPVHLSNIYTDVVDGKIHDLSTAMRAVIIFGGIYLAAEVITITRRVLLDRTIATHEAEIREWSVEKLLKMPVAYYTGGLSAERTAQLNQAVAGFSHLLKICCNDIFSTTLIALCTLLQVAVKVPALITVTVALYLVFSILISVLQIRSQNGIRERIIGQKNALDGLICQSIMNLELIRSLNACSYEKSRLRPDILLISRTEKTHHKYMGFYDCCKQTCKIVFQILVILLSVILVTKGRMNPGDVVAVSLLFQQLVKPIDEVYRFMDETSAALIKSKTLLEITDSAADPVFDIPASRKGITGSGITLENVVITNPEKSSPLAYYTDLHIPGGTTVALRGKNGCGKTTLMRALTRYFPCVNGRITLFGRDLGSFSQKELTDRLFYAPQKAHFFAGTIMDNLLYGLERRVTEAEMIEALQKACMMDVLRRKVGTGDGLDDADVLRYRIGEGGAGLSGGEGQRLTFARAFLRNPSMFIFDESTSNMDLTTESMVLGNLEAYARHIGAGIIYISHEESVVSRCSEVIYLDNQIHALPKSA